MQRRGRAQGSPVGKDVMLLKGRGRVGCREGKVRFLTRGASHKEEVEHQARVGLE